MLFLYFRFSFSYFTLLLIFTKFIILSLCHYNFLMNIFIFSCSAMFRDVPCSGFYRRPNWTASTNNNKLSIELQISYGFHELVNTEPENRPSSHLTKHSSPAARGRKLKSSKELAWNLYTVWHKVLENTKQANSSSFSTYFMISVTDANLLTNAEM